MKDRHPTIQKVHEEAHLGYWKTLCKIRERFYWPRMSSDVKRFCYACQVCKESKTPNINVRPVCGKPKLCSRPWEMISLDFLGPYPRSKKGNVWILPEPLKRSADMEKLFEVVRQNLAKAYQKYSHPYNLRANRRHEFEVGQLVYKKNVHLSDKAKDFVGKFGNKFSPARVQEKLGTNTYVLEDMNGKRIPGTYHGSFLKKA
ncbi:hypothetical protein quinque_002645 [Culex quinquefasciatus]